MLKKACDFVFVFPVDVAIQSFSGGKRVQYLAAAIAHKRLQFVVQYGRLLRKLIKTDCSCFVLRIQLFDLLRNVIERLHTAVDHFVNKCHVGCNVTAHCLNNSAHRACKGTLNVHADFFQLMAAVIKQFVEFSNNVVNKG